MTKILFSLCLLAASLFLSTGCGHDYVFQKEIEIQEGEWRYSDVLVFDFTVEDISKKYDMLLDVTHAGDYGFQNLYVRFQTSYPGGENKTQVVSLELANKTGIWNGACSGNSCTVEIPLQVNALFSETGQHRLSIEQYMRKNPLRGVEAIALKIKANEPQE